MKTQLHNAHVVAAKEWQFKMDSYTVKAALQCLSESADAYFSERKKGGAA